MSVASRVAAAELQNKVQQLTAMYIARLLLLPWLAAFVFMIGAGVLFSLGVIDFTISYFEAVALYWLIRILRGALR